MKFLQYGVHGRRCWVRRIGISQKCFFYNRSLGQVPSKGQVDQVIFLRSAANLSISKPYEQAITDATCSNLPYFLLCRNAKNGIPNSSKCTKLGLLINCWYSKPLVIHRSGLIFAAGWTFWEIVSAWGLSSDRFEATVLFTIRKFSFKNDELAPTV